MERMTYRLGIDVGGTFTDLLLHDSEHGRVWLAKTPSTPHDQSEGVIEGIRLIGAQAGVEPAQLGAILHGTTVATNAVLERRGARVGVFVTQGFRYILHLAEAWTPGPLFGFMIYDKPEAIVDVESMREIRERIDAAGVVIEALDEAAARVAIGELVDIGVEAITVSLINSFANPVHELRLGELCRELAPGVAVSLSCEVLPEFREYERTVTTVMNAYVAPALGRYLANLRDSLSAEGATVGLQVVRSDGGLMSLEAARRMPVHTVLSGPAGGVQGASFVASRAGYESILTFDMGGTSTDVAICLAGMPAITRETSVGDFPVRAPAVDVESIGAGGGSIAYVAEATGALRVGPHSAGATPGPACYGRGGTEATVTDANVVLGHLPPRLLGGAMTLDQDAAHAAVRKVADALGLDVYAAARGIIDVVNEAMLGALRVVTVQKGRAPTEFSLVSFGGAGGLHANALARLLGSYPVIVPPEAGVLSALGFVTSEVKNEFSRTFIRASEDVQVEDLRRQFAELEAAGRGWLASEDVSVEACRIDLIVDMRYHRQGFEIPIDLPASELADLDIPRLAGRFGTEHRRLYGFELDGGAELVNLRVVARGQLPVPTSTVREAGPPDPRDAQSGTQTVWASDVQQHVPVYERSQLAPGMRIDGHAIVEQYDATTVVLPGHIAIVDGWLNLIIEPTKETAR
jgi:N-methylhydantoinase A